jgi:hypothetical protein
MYIGDLPVFSFIETPETTFFISHSAYGFPAFAAVRSFCGTWNMFRKYDLPVAYSILELVRQISEPFQIFMSLWVAFNNVYTAVCYQSGLATGFRSCSSGNKQGTRLITTWLHACHEGWCVAIAATFRIAAGT